MTKYPLRAIVAASASLLLPIGSHTLALEETSSTSIEHSNLLAKVQALPLLRKGQEDIWHLTCFLSGQSRINRIDERNRKANEQQGICCRQIIRTMLEILNADTNSSEIGEDNNVVFDESTWDEYCEHHLAAVPIMSIFRDGNPMQPSPQTLQARTKAVASTTATALADYSLIVRIPHTLNNRTPSTTETYPSNWWLWPATLNVDVQHETSKQSIETNRVFSARAYSELSEDGGMHRQLHHVLTVEVPQAAMKAETSTGTTTISTTLYLLLVLTEDFFMDMDDPIEGGAIQDCGTDHEPPSLINSANNPNVVRCLIRYHLVEGEVVDIEQPAFVSPQHVIGIELSFQHQRKAGAPQSLTFQFTTKVHSRYPSPSANGLNHSVNDTRQAAYQILRKRVGLPGPSILGGYWDSQNDLLIDSADNDGKVSGSPLSWYFVEEARNEENRSGRSHNTAPLDRSDHKQRETGKWLETTVTAGSQDDYPWVVVGTLLCSLIGSALTLRQLSLVSIWDAGDLAATGEELPSSPAFEK